ncbi:RHS repeat-associated core domain-containing protein [Nonomuraea rhodomycinica]|uniref:RHS repeat-associated core domain-containing protein n=1 Tax=Nonomuraea rhodomycinica TaxID=1712872 RepID=A0A7Y6IRX3_9ACTN|nr:RHS repeat-associated core domain-containing protein [Nonomuraea rhodomycinica]NUW43297.1 hypothetical protein [Nonomuraea rhodomycinica]
MEVEHDPSVPGQGSGLIWSDYSSTTYISGTRLTSGLVSSGSLRDGWLIRWRVRGLTASNAVKGPWSEWLSGRVDISKPSVSASTALGTLSSGVWVFSSDRPWFSAVVSDPERRAVGLAVEVEHDPSVPGQGSGLIWSDYSSTTYISGTRLTSGLVSSGSLRDGWLIRWRVRGLTASNAVKGPWSEWQAGKVDVSKPAVSSPTALGTLSSGLWTFSSDRPWFSAVVSDPEGRGVGLAVEVEHDPSVPGQGSGLIWSDYSSTTYTSGTRLTSGLVSSGSLRDGWLIRWRVRGLTANNAVKGPWSEWQIGKVEANKPAGTGLGAVPATQAAGLWTVSSLAPWLYTKVIDPAGAASYLAAEIEHDPSLPSQGTGLIWAGRGTTSYASGSNAWVQVPAEKLNDGWRIRWRVRGVTISGTEGAWSEWQSAMVDLKKPTVDGLGVTPGTEGPGQWMLSSVTPWVFAKVTDPENRVSSLSVEFEHDPSVTDQGSGLIYAGTGTKPAASGSNAWVQVPAAKLSDGWLVRWRVQGITSSGIKGPWSEWQSAKVALNKPSVEGPGLSPGIRGAASWTATTLTPSLYAKATDPENRASFLSIEMEHDPAVPDQGTGQIYAGTATTSYTSGTNAWMEVPSGKLSDGWLVRWRVRATTTSGAHSPWTDWISARVSALPFETFSPANNTQVGTLTPTLSAHARPLNEAEVKYWFQVCAGTQPNWTWCESSTWDKSGTWTVPERKLKWGETYWWYAKAATVNNTVTSSWRTFIPTPEQGTLNSLLGSGTDDRDFNHVSGNYTNTETDASVAVAGPPLSVTRTYNSLDPRTDGVFGAGWSTRWDMRVDRETETTNLLVTYPSGEQLRFAAKGDGTYASPAGTFATLASLPEGGWRLMDKSATSYWFDGSGRLTKISDRRNRTQDLTYGSDGKLAKATGTGGRSLSFTWTGSHVTSVSTDPVNGSPLTWTYSYDGDKLSKVCAPNTGQACTTYTYADASRYRSIVLDAGPSGYWRLNETATAIGTKTANSAGWNISADQAELTGTAADLTAAVSGPLSGTPDTAMRFKGTTNSTYVELPPATISGQGGNLAVEAWFKTTGSGTVIGYQNFTGTFSGGPSAFTPVVYVGTDGKLRGQFYTGTPAPITSATPVNDGIWHHVVLSGAEDTQALFLDGQSVGTLAGKITHVDQWATRIGSGYGSSAWPATTSTMAVFPFAGDIDEVAVYGKPLGAKVVQAHYAARLPQPQMTKTVAPSGRVEAENAYAADGGRLNTHTDANGGIWKLASPAYVKETTALTVSMTTVTDPDGGTLTYTDDALRGYRSVSQTDQLGKVTRYTYDTGGFPAKVIDPNGNVVETAFNSRGNMLSKRMCRTADNCSSEYYSYFLNVDDPFDPRNDLKTVYRDGRSASATDETYMASWTLSPYGEETKQTTPVTPDFPEGRSTAKIYTGGTEPAVGGGLTPAGLLKSVKDYKGNETIYAYTAAGDLATETSPTGLVKKYEHDALGRVVKQTEISQAFPSGVTTTIAYDALGKVTSRTGSGVKNEVTGATHTLRWSGTYDPDGLPLTETQEDLTGGDITRTVTYTYDAYGRTETVTDPEGGVQRYAYDHMGQKTDFTDERGTTYHYGYTSRGELVTSTLKGWTGSPITPDPTADVVLTSIAYDPAGRLASQTDAMGRTTAFTYYNDNLPAEKIAKGARLNGSTTPRDVVLESLTYDAAGHLTRRTSDNGALRVDMSHDAAGRVISQAVDPERLNRVTTAAYDANDNLVKIKQSAGGTDRVEITEYAYDAGDRPVRQTVHNDGQDLVSTLTVDDRGLVTAMTDPRGNVPNADPSAYTTTIHYNAAGLATQIQLPAVTVEHAGAVPANQRPTTRLGYNTYGEQTHQVDAEGRTLTMVLDRIGRMVEQILPVYTPPGGQSITPKSTATYDAAGDLISFSNTRGQITKAVYDALGRKVQVTTPKAGVWNYGYDLLGETLWQTDPIGARSESTYDDLGRQITLTTIERKPSQAAYVTSMEYDDADRVTKTIRPTGDASTRTYDATGALTSQTDALGNTTTFAYDLAGRPVKTTNPLGNASTATYDRAGRKTQTEELDAQGTVLRTLKYGYDFAGNPTSKTSAEGHTTTQAFDAGNRLIERKEPVSATETITTSFGYDAAGAQTRSTDGRGNATFITYNSLGLTESVLEPSTVAHPSLADRTWTTLYDAAGNPVTSLIPGGVRVDRVFDELSRLVKESGTGAEAATEDKTFGYDPVGRLIAANDLTFTLNDRGLLLKSAGPGGDLNVYAYDANNRLIQRVDAAGASTFAWDDADRLTQAVDPVSATTIDYGYDKANRLTSMAYGASGTRRSYTYDAMNRLTKDQLTTSAGGAIASLEYGYDRDGNMTAKTTTGTAGAGANTYTYDWSNRLTSWTSPDGTKTEYGWDAAGNRIRAGAKTYTYDERNRLTSGDGRTYTYSARGTLKEEDGGAVRMTKFDAFDRMVRDGAVTYDYDALDRVESRASGDKATRMTYDGLSNNLVAVTDAGGARTASFGRDALGRTLGISDGAGAQLAFSDQHGDLIGTFTTDGATLADSVAYDPFGEVTTRTGNAHTLGYQGGYTDPDSGKINMAARWYQPTTGSFVSRDTLAQAADPSVQLNRYTYANANPLTNTDPDGHASCKKKCQTAKQKEYNACVKNGFKGKGCADDKKIYIAQKGFKKDCVTGYHSFEEESACKQGAQTYTQCRLSGKSAKSCETRGVNTACRNFGGGDRCDLANPVYDACRANKGTKRSVCVEGNQQYMLCDELYPVQRGQNNVCSGAAKVYEGCRSASPQPTTSRCAAVRELYAQCAYDGYSAQGRHGYDQSAGTCGKVAGDASKCVQRGAPGGVCFSVGIIHLNCLMEPKAKAAGCNNLADFFYHCVAHPKANGCGDKPEHICEDFKDRVQGDISKGKRCSDVYSPAQAWLKRKGKLMEDPDADYSAPCAAIPVIAEFVKPIQGAAAIAETACTYLGSIMNLTNQKEAESLNQQWKETVKNNPGQWIAVRFPNTPPYTRVEVAWDFESKVYGHQGRWG